MGQQIIRQPNGKYAVFSSGTDTIIVYDATAEEIIDYFVNRAVEDTRLSVQSTLDKIANGERPYYQFTMTWETALELDRAHGGTAWRSIEQSVQWD